MSVAHPLELPAGERRVAPLVDLLARYGEQVALTGNGAGSGLSYAALAARVDAFATALGPARRLVLLEAGNDTDTLVAWLGSAAAGCPVLLTGPGAARDALVAAYDPDVVWDGELREVRAETTHDLHPDLALLLSTSGSTGSPKLVRLSHRNLLSNARAIASYLGVRASDVAATTLPVHYCYGLSVVHSHLVAGATVHLTDRSVTDPEFWEEARAAGVTTFPGVPHTFEMLDALGFTGAELPTLRYLTQAGGKLAPEAVRRQAQRGATNGWDLVVMYGATEATARMAFLPPHLAEVAPETIGIPIPGGSITVEPRPDLESDPEIGELVYRGDNVMLGYATTPAELALGRTVHELRTGDLGRQREDGLFEVVGRCSRIAKVFGLRVDLDRVERALVAAGTVSAVADGGDALVVAVASGAARVETDRVRAQVREVTGLPPAGVRVVTPSDLPRLASGKVDYRAIATLGASPATRDVPETVTAAHVADLFATLLGRPATEADSFRSLGGDSLSYVEASLRLEELLGTLPVDWTSRPAADLATHARPYADRSRAAAAGRLARWFGPQRTVETSVVLRALAIVSIVGTHANLLVLLGGAHTLLAVLGFNYARFHVDLPRAERTRAVLRSVGRIALPAMLVIGTVSTYKHELGWRQVLLLNWLLGPRFWINPDWRYWFIEVAVALTLAVTALLAVPTVSRLAARHRFAFPLALAVVALVPRFALRVVMPDPRDATDIDVLERTVHLGPLTLGGGDFIHEPQAVLWLFALGWAAAMATTTRQRLLVTALAVVGLHGFFLHEPAREAYVLAGIAALVWVRHVRIPDRIARPAGVLAAASMWIYLVHWEVYPHLEHRIPLLATLLSLAAGVAAWKAWTYGEAVLRARGRPCGALTGAQHAASRGRDTGSTMDRYVLTLRCPDQPGIIRAFAEGVVQAQGNIVDNKQYSDPDTGTFSMRTEFDSPLTDVGAVRSLIDEALAAYDVTLTLRPESQRRRVLLMVSKADHCLLDLLYRWESGELPVDIPVIVSNHTDLQPIAERHGIPFVHVPVTKETKPAAEARLLELVEEHAIDFVVLARYMQVLSDDLCSRLPGRIINIHHSFLPGFKGAKPYHQAHARGVKLIGATAHYVTADLDEGPIIEQDVTRVDHAWTAEQLVAHGRDVERLVLSRAVSRHAEDRVLMVGVRTIVFG